MNRRDFLKIVGITTATSTAALYGCGSKEGSSEGSKVLGPIPTDKMTYRSFPGLGSDKVSILGYGCMRWPTVPAPDGKGEMIDQDAVNELVDYAIAHGVNYFDTSPMYVQGWSEKSTGIALKRHPRESFYLATKLSNFHPDTWTREGSIAMYRKSFEDMQVDYIDYYLLHMIGGGGMEQFRKRYIDNGMIDFLVKEREAGRIRRLGWSFHGDIEVYDYALQMHDRGEVHWDFVQIQLNYVDWKHASGSNFKAEYLYDELAKRKIPAVIMEPLLGGRLSNVPDHIVARLKQREPERSVASWAFRYAGSPQDVLTVLSGMTYMEHLQDNIRTYSPLVPLTEEETQKAIVFTLIVIIGSIVISLSPVKAWERIEIQIVVQPVFVLGKQMVSTYSQQIESHCGDIPIQRDIGRRENTIVPVGTVESCRHQSDSKFGVTGIMRPAYNAEIKFLVFLFFVGIVEVIQNFSEKTAFLGKRVYRIRRN